MMRRTVVFSWALSHDVPSTKDAPLSVLVVMLSESELLSIKPRSKAALVEWTATRPWQRKASARRCLRWSLSSLRKEEAA